MTEHDDLPVLVTGASGYIARHVLRDLLDSGHRVRASLRSLDKADEVRDALRPALSDPAAADTRLDFVRLDLTRDDGWAGALAGTRALIHTASPFPLSQPKDRDDLIRPAVGGTERALQAAAAAGVTRVVLTSSIAAIITQDPLDRATPRTEADWTDPDHPACTAYSASKTLAERRAWDLAGAHGLDLTTVNPGLVVGPPLGGRYGSSVSVVRRILSAKDPGQPRLMADIVHVRDVARLHVLALETPATAGSRLIATGGAMWFGEIAGALRAAFPDRKIKAREVPDWMIRFIGLFDGAAKSIVPVLGARMFTDAATSARLTGIDFVPAREAVIETAQWLVDNAQV
ncbi:hypothetical protein ATO6_15115 [Oceanicola sp. 22II-s10i]|uniref:SDR family oxidoreductase n=1 Tax=Oceanicola sp. 22II-s10i TaxID=1317116 RepID=UPI000B51F8E2|nr:aldehyde reductase [Oceanicola sp. 22II-s10i]OWU84337.1 hypothetical protein ATO6_15115 [Oceanicola sp. 22II-s10i]